MIPTRQLRPIVTALLLVAHAPSVRAQGRACDDLQGSQRALADRLLASQHPYDWCDGTLAECLARRPGCTPLRRLADNLCRRVAAGGDESRITRWLARRGVGALALDRPAAIDLNSAEAAGEPGATVTAVLYASARGPQCARVVPGLHQAVVRGRLAGKVRLFLKPFPIRRNPHYKQAGLAFMAAAELGHLWDFVRYAYDRFDRFDPAGQAGWAEAVGLDGPRFQALLADKALLKRLSAGKREGLDNGVAATPALFVDGHRYLGELAGG